MDLAIDRQPAVTDLQPQQGLATDQAQDIAQVIAIQRGQCALPAFTEAIHQQCGVRGDGIAVHQP
ncbi:hypothetical protein D3C80_1868990 [compost metagenome]